VAKFLLSRAVRDAGIKVVFTGEGSDEILGGYAPFRRDMLLYNSEGQDPAETRRLLDAMEASNRAFPGLIVQEGQVIPELAGLSRRLGWVPSWIATTATGATRMRPLLRDDFVAEWSRLDPFQPALDDLPTERRLAGRDPVNQALYLWSRLHLPNYVLTLLSDRMEMSHSIEGRVPFLDHLLAEYVAHVPVHHKIRGMRTASSRRCTTARSTPSRRLRRAATTTPCIASPVTSSRAAHSTTSPSSSPPAYAACSARWASFPTPNASGQTPSCSGC
jgi:asparagine synthase (glutamine-hydrolysing)